MTTQRKCFVYWAHLEEHLDILKDGYVGITVDPCKRWSAHKRSAIKGKVSHFSSALRKYGDKIVFDVLAITATEDAQRIEKKLRPDKDIGWNISIGGSQTFLGQKHSDEAKRKISLSSIKNQSHKNFLGRTQFKSDNCMFQKEPWDNQSATESSLHFWSAADKAYQLWKDNGECGQRRLCKLLGIDYSSPPYNAIVKFRNGWIPCDDPNWVKFKLENTR